MAKRDEANRPGGYVEVAKVSYAKLDDQLDSDQRDLIRTRALRDVLQEIQSSIRAYSSSLQIDTCYFAIKGALSKAKKIFQDDWLGFQKDAEQQQVVCITSTNLQLNASLEQAYAIVQKLEHWVEQKGPSPLPAGWEIATESAINALHKHESKVLARTSLTTAKAGTARQTERGDRQPADDGELPGKKVHQSESTERAPNLSKNQLRAVWIAQALMLRTADPNMSKVDIARQVGIHPGQLSPARCPELAALDRMLLRGTTSGYLKTGSQSGSDDVEAVVSADGQLDRGKQINGSHLFREYCADCDVPIRVTEDKISTHPRCEDCAS